MAPSDDQISAILNDPEKMQKIMALAQSFQEQDGNTPKQEEELPGIDPALLKKISGIAANSGIDRDQRNLLNALSPYLSHQRIRRLERAMRAAKLANAATTLLGQAGDGIV